jgi:hypothetical protein
VLAAAVTMAMIRVALVAVVFALPVLPMFLLVPPSMTALGREEGRGLG